MGHRKGTRWAPDGAPQGAAPQGHQIGHRKGTEIGIKPDLFVPALFLWIT
jgi:hypothetical protein